MFDTIHVTDEEMDDLPEGVEGFLAFESLVRNRLFDMGKSEQDGLPSLDQRYSYFSHVSEAADHFDIPEVRELRIAPGNSWGYDESKKTAQQIDTEVMKLRFKNRRRRQGSYIELSDGRTQTIQHHIAQLRVRIADSDLDPKKQAALNKKLDELLAELNGTKKVDLAKVMVILGSIATFTAAMQQNVIKFPETMATIAALLDQQKDETEALRLASAPKLLIEDKSTSSDDDIPF
jgi:hypothetical protein